MIKSLLGKPIKKIKFYSITIPTTTYYLGKTMQKKFRSIPYRPKPNKYIIGGLLVAGLLSITKNCNLLEKKIYQNKYQKPTQITEIIQQDYSDNRLEQILESKN